MLAKVEGEVLNPKHVENPPEDQNATAGAGQSVHLTQELAKPNTSFVKDRDGGLEGGE
jgi:hypothetical protein